MNQLYRHSSSKYHGPHKPVVAPVGVKEESQINKKKGDHENLIYIFKYYPLINIEMQLIFICISLEYD